MAGDSAIWRATTAQGGTEAAALSANKVEFNQGSTPDSTANIVSTSMHWVEDISFQPNPARHLSQIQAGKLGTWEVVVVGYMKDNTGANSSLTNLSTWMQEDKDVATTFPFGRFGIRLDDNPLSDLVPTETKGYILYDLFVARPENSENEKSFIAKFYRNGTP